jgi:serine/threonine protein kinase
MLLEYAEFGSLTKELQQRKAFQHYSMEKRLALLLPIARALEFLHSLGVVHGDICPNHVLVFPDCQLKLCDFQKAIFWNKEDADLYTPGKGTEQQSNLSPRPYYGAPEILKNKKLQPAVDVFSFGLLILIFVVYIQKIFETDARHIHLLLSQHWEPCADLVVEMLQEDAQKRPTMSQVVKKMGEFINSPR